jgi:hypothetical protein
MLKTRIKAAVLRVISFEALFFQRLNCKKNLKYLKKFENITDLVVSSGDVENNLFEI